MSILIVPSETSLVDHDAFEANETQPQQHESQSIKEILVETEKNLEILIKVDTATIDKLVNELQLSLLKKLKQALEQLANGSINSDDGHGFNEKNNEKEMVGYHEHKWNGSADLSNTLSNTLAGGDTVSVASGATILTGITKATDVTGITGVSSIAPPLSMDDPLIVMIGIGKYDGMPNLDGIARDYDNMIDTFVNYWKYKIFYKLNNNTCIYSNNKSEMKTNYKLEWDSDEIYQFIEESRKYLVKNRHNGLIFGISSHGDSGRILYDSECEEYALDSIFSMYSPQASQLLETYQETEEESNHLFSIAKIFFLDMCRGTGQAKVTNVTNIPKVAKVAAQKADSENVHAQTENETEKENKTQEHDAISLHKSEEKIVVKGIGKDEARTLVGQMANFSKLYANIEGFSVGDGSLHGGIFLRSVCKVFKDTKYVSSHKFTQMIFKIREYTKRAATLNGTLFNFTQIVENEGTLEREVVFGSKYANILPQALLFNHHLSTLDETTSSHFDSFMNNNVAAPGHNKIYITNMSLRCDIAVLIEMEQNRENRREMFETLENSSEDDNYEAFVDNGFVIIGKTYGSHEFDKVWDEYYVTAVMLRKGKKNQLIYDRRMYFSDDLYFKNKQLNTLNDSKILPKCNAISHNSHSLLPILNTNESKNTTNIECRLCLTTIGEGRLSFECKECNESICKDCCKSLIINKTPPRMKESKLLNLTMINASKTHKIAVFVCIYDSYNKQKREIIEQHRYKEIEDENEFIENGFIIINPNGKQHTFKNVWQSAFITIIELVDPSASVGKNEASEVNQLMYDEKKEFNQLPLYYINTAGKNKLFNLGDILPKCHRIQNESHPLHPIHLNNDNDSTIDKKCTICMSNMGENDNDIFNYIYFCQECEKSLCHRCIDSIICDKIPSNFKTKQVLVYNYVLSKNKVAVLLDTDYKYYDLKKNRAIMGTNISEQEYIKYRCKIINPGEVVSVNAFWQSYRVTMIELGKKRKVVCDMKTFGCSDLLFFNHKVYSLLEQITDAKCKVVENKSHALTRILVNEESIDTISN